MPTATFTLAARFPRARSMYIALVVLAGMAAPALAQESAMFPREYLEDPKNIALGKSVWVERCTFCHGMGTYPGKAPRLEPKRYLPEFVYARVTFGFRGMPAWQEGYSEEQRRAVVAWVMSPEFTP